MDIPIDVFENTSEELSALIAAVLDSEDFAQTATLVQVRDAILAEVKTVTIPLNRFSSDQWQGLRGVRHNNSHRSSSQP
jgi:hypothetical protein